MYQNFSYAGKNYKVDFFETIEEGKKTTISIEAPYFKLHRLKVYYQSPDPKNYISLAFGYYVNLPLADGKKKKLYIDFM